MSKSRPTPNGPLRIALLTYRGKAHCGGQGVYTRYIARALTDLGHHVEVFSGNPYPEIDDDIQLHKLPSLDIWNDTYPGRMPAFWELKSLPDVAETLGHTIGTFSEPMSFSWRVYDALKDRLDDFDLIHDNQTLGWGILALQQAGLPVLETIHHPITVDRKLEIEHSRSKVEEFGKRRWYAFTKMQTKVARRMVRVMTVSESSLGDICNDHKVSPDRIHVVPVGVDPDLFKPLPDVQRVPGRIVTTASADVVLKGLHYLLEALAKLRTEREDAHLVIIGKPKDGGKAMDTLARLGLEDHVEWISGVPDQRIVELYSECSVACVPSLYEGFSLPAIEAMASAAPLVVTTGGALPEVVGEDGVGALLVDTGNSDALAAALSRVLEDPELGAELGANARARVLENWSWHHTAIRTIEQYELLLDEFYSKQGQSSLGHSNARANFPREQYEPNDSLPMRVPALRPKCRHDADADAITNDNPTRLGADMLTVDYDRLGLQAGHELLDLGCGFGRHAFEAARRGAHVTACDMAVPELVDVRNTFGAMHDAGELDDSVRCTQIAGDATRLPFEDNTFDRIIASEVLEHIPSDIDALTELTRVLKPGGVIAATVPTFLPERICWAINSDYHAPVSVGGHVRIYTRGEMRAKMSGVGLKPIDAHQTHGLHSPYWWLKCAVGIDNNDHPLVKKYHDLLVWEITDQPKGAAVGWQGA